LKEFANHISLVKIIEIMN